MIAFEINLVDPWEVVWTSKRHARDSHTYFVVIIMIDWDDLRGGWGGGGGWGVNGVNDSFLVQERSCERHRGNGGGGGVVPNIHIW